MMQEIQHADVLEISNRLANKGIPTDFKGNKVIAWCCDKTVGYFEQLNEKFGTQLALPKGIYAEDFRNLNVDSSTMYGFCNLAPVELKKGSDEIIPSRVVFFNTLHNWNDINSISDTRYVKKHSGTDFFLDIFLHEFSHVAHEDRLLGEFDGATLLEMLESVKSPQQALSYKKKYGAQVSKVCRYASTDQLEAVACDLSKRMAKSIDKTTLSPTKNPFSKLPYQEEDLSLCQNLKTKIYPLNKILRNFWNGKFD